MIVTTIPSIEGCKITAYQGVFGAETIMGPNIVRDFDALVPDMLHGGAFDRFE